MPRNTIERELLVDSFDDEIAFAYAYRYQETLNNHLSVLSTLAAEVMREAQEDAAMMSLPASVREGSHYCVVNGLHKAVRAENDLVETSEIEHGWWHMPDDWNYQQLKYHLNYQIDAPWMLLQALSDRLEQALPQSVKPFTSFDQVLAITSEVLADWGKLMRHPVHKPSLATAMHAVFIERHSNPTTPDVAEGLLRNALQHYRNLTHQAGVEMIRDRFCERMIAKLMQRARALDIVIGRHYPWGALIEPPRPATVMLTDFAALINDDRTWYKKWSPRRVRPEKLQKIPFLNFLFRGVPSVEPRSASGPIYFSSERSRLVLEGVPLQNRLVLVLPYDQPFPELKHALTRFEKYFLRRAATHRANLGDAGAREHERDMQRHSAFPEPKVERVIVVRVTSIPMHLAALRSFEPDRPEEKRKPRTTLKMNIHDDFIAHGFDLDLSAIEDALENASKFQQAVMTKLDRWSGRSQSD